MDCETTREAIARGDALSPEAQAHVDSCVVCGSVLRDAISPRPALEFDALFASISAEVEAEHGVVSGLRERLPTERVALGLLAMALTTVVVYATTRRVDMAVYPLLRLGLEMGALSIAAALALWWGMRPLYLPEPPRWVVPTILGALCILPFASGLLPIAHLNHPASLEGAGADLWVRAIKCLLFGIVTAVPTLLVAGALQRVQTPGRNRLLLAAIAAGSGGIVALAVHCPITQPLHLVVGHAPVILGVIACALVARFARR